MIADVVRRLTVRNLPEQRALLQIDRCDSTVRGLDQRKPLHRRRDVRCLWIGWIVRLPPGVQRVRRPTGAFLSWHESERRDLGIREDIEYARLRIERSPLPVCSTGRSRQHERSKRTVELADDRRREDWT